MPAARLPLAIQDYQRIFRVLKAVADGADLDSAAASTFLSVAGAHLIEKHYSKKCQPVAGSVSFKLDDAAQTVIRLLDEGSDGDANGYHCWIVCDGHVIDFMAPVFMEYLHAKGFAGRYSRKMFQKPIGAMVDSPLRMTRPGDFYMLPDVGLTRQVLSQVSSDERLGELVQICMHWYKRPSREMPREISTENAAGEIRTWKLADTSLDGVW